MKLIRNIVKVKICFISNFTRVIFDRGKMILIRNIVKVKICGSHCTTNGNMENSRHSNFSGTVRFSYWVRLLCDESA